MFSRKLKTNVRKKRFTDQELNHCVSLVLIPDTDSEKDLSNILAITWGEQGLWLVHKQTTAKKTLISSIILTHGKNSHRVKNLNR